MYKLKQSLLSIIIGLAFAAGISYAAPWIGPTTNPTGGNVAAPINVGNVTQIKKGALGVEGVFRAGSNAIFNDSLTIKDGTQGVGKVLTSNANGNASWQNRVNTRIVTTSANGTKNATSKAWCAEGEKVIGGGVRCVEYDNSGWLSLHDSYPVTDTNGLQGWLGLCDDASYQTITTYSYAICAK